MEKFSDDINVGEWIKIDGCWHQVTHIEEPWADCGYYTRDLYVSGDLTCYTGTYEWSKTDIYMLTCLKCGSGVLNGEHIRKDLPPCY